MSSDLITPSATALWFASGTNLKTLSVSPSAVGSLMVFTTTYIATGTLTAVAGGGVTTWGRIAGPITNTSATPVKIDMWMGVVTTAGTSTITMTVTATNTNRLNCKEFKTAGGAHTVWTQDGAGGTKANGTATTTVTYPTLTPSGINRLYVGYGTNGTASQSGMTSGYTVELDFGSNPFLYNPSVPNSAQTPTSVTTSNTSYTVGALIKADNQVGSFMSFFGMGHHENELEQRPNGLYVQRRKLIGVRPDGGTRVLARA